MFKGHFRSILLIVNNTIKIILKNFQTIKIQLRIIIINFSTSRNIKNRF